MDQAIVEVKEATGSIAGYDIVVANLEQMPMPIILEVTTKSGKKEVIRVRVDVWMRNKVWTVFYPAKEEVISVVLDPHKVLPDVNEGNNVWLKK